MAHSTRLWRSIAAPGCRSMEWRVDPLLTRMRGASHPGFDTTLAYRPEP
ncbi:MAG: hypothetical protein QNJ63_07510 [Calothrix sp. MO_192.B10]|nr:hypothetical protein [Calothrix sp. MO_192.B10]